MKDFLTNLLYFIGATVLLGSIGIWFSISVDFLPDGIVSDSTKESIPGNILTYGLAILAVAAVDRGRWLLKNKFYQYKELEFLAMVPVGLIGLGLAYYSLHCSFKHDLHQATLYAIYTTLLSYVAWWIANSKPSHTDPVNAMGGVINP